MTLKDTSLLAKKIALGIVVSIVPLAIVAGGLWVTQRFATDQAHAGQISSVKGTSHAN